MVPILLVAAACYPTLEGLIRFGRESVGPKSWVLHEITLVLLLIGSSASIQRPGVVWPDGGLNVLTSSIEDFAAERTEVSIQFERDDDWTILAGILLDLERRGVKGCTTRQNYSLILTPSHLCGPEMVPQLELVPEKMCGSGCLGRGGGYGVRRYPIAISRLDHSLTQSSSGSTFLNWVSRSSGEWWSVGHLSSILLNLEGQIKPEGEMVIVFRTLGPQRLTLTLNGRILFNGTLNAEAILSKGAFSPGRTRLKIHFAQDVVLDGPNIISFSLPDAASPGNGDLRELAIWIEEVWIH